MHPLLAEPGRIRLYMAAWLPVAAAMIALRMLAASPLDEAAAVTLPLLPPFAFLCLSSWHLCRALPLGTTPPARLLATLVGAAAISASLWQFAGHGWVVLLAGVFPGAPERVTQQTPLMLALGTLLYLLAAALHYVLAAFDEQRRAEQRALEVEVLAREAELLALRAQLQPHFLFNSLNSISALTSVDAAGARQMCLRLAEFLRQSLELGGRASITLGEELALVESFLAVEKIRHGTRLSVDVQLDAAARACLVPPLLLQPLVENAVGHGIAHLLEGGTLTLRARCQGGRLEITVANPCDSDRRRKPGPGVGLENVRRRLQAAYGRDARLQAQETDGEFRVELTLPG